MTVTTKILLLEIGIIKRFYKNHELLKTGRLNAKGFKCNDIYTVLVAIILLLCYFKVLRSQRTLTKFVGVVALRYQLGATYSCGLLYNIVPQLQPNKLQYL